MMSNILEFGADDTELIKCYERAIKLARKNNKKLMQNGDHDHYETLAPEPGPWQPVIKMNISSPSQEEPKMSSPTLSLSTETAAELTEEYSIGSYCRAVWEVDDVEYEGEVTDIVGNDNGNFAIVRFVGFGNEEEVELSKLKPSLGKGAQDLQRVAAYDYEMELSKEQEISNNDDDDEEMNEEENEPVQQQGQDNFKEDKGIIYFNESGLVDDEIESESESELNKTKNSEPEPDVVWHDAKSTFPPSAGIITDLEKIKPQYINENFNIGFVGSGETLKNIAFPLIDKCVLNPKNVIVFGINVDHLKPWEDYSCQTSTSLATLLTNSSIVIWSCNPKTFPKFCDQASKVVTKMNLNSLHVTLIEDLSLEDFKNQLKTSFQIPHTQHMFKTARIVPLIFNKMDRTKTASLYIPGSKPREIIEKEKEIIVKIFGQSGMCYEIKETQINGYRALVENGMSLIFPVIETLSDCGLKVGIPRSNSNQIVSYLMASASTSIISQLNNSLEEIKDVILKPGGSSIVGVLELEKSGVRASYINAFNAICRKENDVNTSKRKKKDNS